MFDFMKIEKTVSDVQQSLALIEEMQNEILEQISNLKEMIQKRQTVEVSIPYLEP